MTTHPPSHRAFTTVPCPRCTVVLTDIPGPGHLERVCPTCSYRYAITSGYIEEGEITPLHSSHPQEGYRVTLQLELARRERTVLQFNIGGKTPQLPAQQGDFVSAIQTLDARGRRDEMTHFTNHDRQTATPLTPALLRPRTQSGCLGCGLVLGLTATVPAFLKSGDFGSAIATVFFLTLLFFLYRKRRPALPAKTSLDSQTQAQLVEARDLLQRRTEVHAKLATIQARAAERHRTRAQLIQLRDKMQGTDAALFSGRLAQIQRTLDIHERLDRSDAELSQEYEKILKFLEIEMDTRALHDSDFGLPSQDLTDYLELMRAAEAESQDLRFELEAEQELITWLQD